MKANLIVISTLKPGQWLTTDRHGTLGVIEEKSKQFIWKLKDLSFFGALHKRLKQVIFLSFLTFLIELTNPFDKESLRRILYKKLTYVRHILPKVYRINNQLWDFKSIEREMYIYEKRSLLQYKIIHEVFAAVKKTQETDSIKEARLALNKGLFPLLITQGCSGAYWLRDTKREIIGLFKPFDEEIHAPNNPIGPRYQGSLGERKTRWGVRVGEACHREVAAYVVDQFFGFGIIPNTTYASFSHQSFYDARENLYMTKRKKTKMGSFQEYVSGFSGLIKFNQEEIASIPEGDYQLLVVLDIIIGNTDRNAGNFLVGDNQIAAVDHGLCFPDLHDSYSTWYWKLSLGEKPFYSSLTKLLIDFPFEKLGWKLKKQCYISHSSLRCMKERIMLVNIAIEEGLNSPKLLAPFYSQVQWGKLIFRDHTLMEIAREVVREYKENPPKNEK